MSRARFTALIVAIVMSALALFALALSAELNMQVIPQPAMVVLWTCAVLCWLTFMTLTVVDHIDRRFRELRHAITDYGSNCATEAAVTARLNGVTPTGRSLHPLP